MQKRDTQKLSDFKAIYEGALKENRQPIAIYYKKLIAFFFSQLQTSFLWIDTTRKSGFYFVLTILLTTFDVHYKKILHRVNVYKEIQKKQQRFSSVSSEEPEEKEEKTSESSLTTEKNISLNKFLEFEVLASKKRRAFVKTNEPKLIQQWHVATQKLLTGKGSISRDVAFKKLYEVISAVSWIIASQSLSNPFVPTQEVVFQQSFDSVSYDVSKLANLTDNSNAGTTVLHWAVYFHEDCFLLHQLLSHKIIVENINKRNAEGRTPLDQAIEFQKEISPKDQTTQIAQVINLLKQYGGKRGEDLIKKERVQQEIQSPISLKL